MVRAEVPLTTVGMIYDIDQTSCGLPAKDWHDLGVAAIGEALRDGLVMDQCLATLPSEQWEAASAHEMVELTLVMGAILAEVNHRVRECSRP